MKRLKREELRSLIEKRNGHCVSIYLPTSRTGSETRQDQIRLNNLLHEAEDRLLTLGLEEKTANLQLKPARQFMGEERFRRHQSDGLALFLSEKFFHYCGVPSSFPEMLVVTDRFYLKPLLRYFASEGRYYLLSLSRNLVRVYAGSHHHLSEIFLPGMPANLTNALGQNEGQDGEDEECQDRLARFCRIINVCLREWFKEEQIPLILAGPENLLSIYHLVNTYPHLLSEGIRGNHEQTPTGEMQREAWAIVSPYDRRRREEALAEYRQLSGAGKTTNHVGDAVIASAEGRIATLFIPARRQCWGSFDERSRTVIIHSEAEPGDEDLFDLAALQTFASGGTVFTVEPEQLSDNALVAAILRD